MAAKETKEIKKPVAIQTTKIHKCIKAASIADDARISKDACEYLTNYINAAVIAIAKEAFVWAQNSGRHTIKVDDIVNAIPRYKVEGFTKKE